MTIYLVLAIRLSDNGAGRASQLNFNLSQLA